MLHFRNTFKNSKLMILYMFLAIFSLVVSAIAFLLAMLPEFRIIGIILCVLFGLLFVINDINLYEKNLKRFYNK